MLCAEPIPGELGSGTGRAHGLFSTEGIPAAMSAADLEHTDRALDTLNSTRDIRCLRPDGANG